MSSIRRNLTTTLCLAAALLLPIGSFVIFLTARQVLIAQFDATLAAKAEALITAAEIDDGEFEIDLDVQQFAGFGSPFAGDFFEVRHLDGRVVARSPSLMKGQHLDIGKPLGNQNHWSGEISLPENRKGRAVLERFTPSKDRKNRFGALELIVASDAHALDRMLRSLAIVLLATSVFGLGVTIVLLRFGLRRGLQPLSSMATEVSALRIGREGLRIETASLPDELRVIGGKLNDLLRRVETSLSRERRFSSHAAHELRTPLAELKMMIELIRSWPDEATPERTAEMLGVIGELESLLDKLSLLARTEAGALPVRKARVDLRSSVESAVQRNRLAATERGIIISTEVTDGLFETDPVLWQTILGNLIGNAADHAPGNSMVRVEASPRTLSVSNIAPDLSLSDVDSIFDRFWRKDTAHTGIHHSGLGLSIVQNCVELLGGVCHASLSPDGELRIEVAWDGPSALPSEAEP